MYKNKGWLVGYSLLVVIVMAAFIALSNWMAPNFARRTEINHYNFLSWGAPALFYESVDDTDAMLKLEPWRILGLQLPALAGIQPGEWVGVQDPPDDYLPVNPPVQPPPQPRPNLGNVVVGIYHAHTTEGFVPTSGTAFPDDPTENMVAVGKVITEILESNGIRVIHRTDVHDKPDHKKSYENARTTAQEMIAEEPEMVLLIDLHRDGAGTTKEQARAATTTTINEKQAGRIMFVIGTGHANYQRNNRVALDLYNLMENKYPGLGKPNYFNPRATFNQDLHPAAILAEVGGHWNTLEEAIYGAELFAEVLVEYLEGLGY